MQHELAMHGTIPCMVETEPDWLQPVMVSTYWPIGHGAAYCRELIEAGEQPAISEGDHGMFTLAFATGMRVDIMLTEGGKTLPVHKERTPIAKPRGKNTWRNGAWQRV